MSLKSFIKSLKKKSKYSFRTGWQGDSGSTNATTVSGYVSAEYFQGPAVTKSPDKKDERIVKKPVEVFKEILTEEPKMNLTDLDGQIKIVKRRKKLLDDELGMACTDEKEALILLHARKKYEKYKDEFRWAVTTTSKIEALCKKYKLRKVGFQSYYKSIPMEAIDELEKFLDSYKKIRKDSPVLELIIDEGGKETKKDPILLASSPFGKWYYVLGAWDKEVEIVDALVYHGK